MKKLAIITARGGSKRIPRKNIKEFLGKPIIAYSIQAAIESGVFDEVMVSTDDKEIANVALELGASVPFYRTPGTADDFSTTADVLVEVLQEYKKQKMEFDYTCCIYPTAPFVTAEKLRNAFEVLIQSKADTVIPITKFSFPIWRSFNKSENGKLSFNWPENAVKRSQDLEPAFHDCGQFYFFNTDKFLQTKKLLTNNTIGIEMPESQVQDIDNEEDWKIAEIKYSFLQNQ